MRGGTTGEGGGAGAAGLTSCATGAGMTWTGCGVTGGGDCAAEDGIIRGRSLRGS